MRTKRLPQCLCLVFAGLAVTAVASCGGSPASPAPAAQGASSGTAGGTVTAPATGASGPAASGAAASGAAGSNGKVPTASVSYCTNAPSSLIQSTLGLAVGKEEPTIEGPVAVCAYTGKYEVLVRFQINESAGQFSLDRKSAAGLHQTVTTVSHLGDDAFTAVVNGNGPANITLAARKGTVAVFITSPASVTAERTLMTRLLAQV